MFSLKVFTVIVITSCVYANPTETGLKGFIKEYAGGDAEKNIKPMDPIIVENINVPEENFQISSHFSELIVTGLKDAVVSEFTKDEKNVAHLDLTFKLDAEGPISVQFLKKVPPKSINGTADYEADIKIHVESVAIDDFGPESVTCEASNATYKFDEKFTEQFTKDPDATTENLNYDDNKYTDKITCAIAKAMIKVVFDNLRAAIAAGL